MRDHGNGGDGRSHGGESRPTWTGGGRPMPLNSRRVTGPILRSVAAKLGLPTRASAEEMIDGRLEELGREPRDVLVGGLWKPTSMAP